MKKIYIMVQLFCLIIILLSTVTFAASDVAKFHPAQTDAEKTLNKILDMDKEDKYLEAFVFKLPTRTKNWDKAYDILFTKGLQSAWEKAYLSIPLEKDGSKYIDINFITCSQDKPERYLFATTKSSSSEAYIDIAWPQFATNKPSNPPYRMVKKGNTWQLDGIRCQGNFTFNTNFNFTKSIK